MQNGILILALRHPAKVFIGSGLDAEKFLLIDEKPAWASFPPWPTCPDILYNSESRVVVGLTYSVGQEFQTDVKEMCKSLDPAIIRYNDFAEGQNTKPYSSEHREPHHLEILWSCHEPDAFALAQLCDDTWYYTEDEQVIALSLSNLDDILTTYNLALPDRFPYPEMRVRRNR